MVKIVDVARLKNWSRYSRQFGDLWETQGATGVARRLRSRVAELLAPRATELEVLREHVLGVNLSQSAEHTLLPRTDDEPITLNWVITPAAAGSGGHTTAYRIINFLQRSGYDNRIYLYDVYRGDHTYYADIARAYYGFAGSIAKLEDGMQDAHGVFATSWPTAYAAMHSRCSGKRFYFVQDYEPYFYPQGSHSVLAENTYRMGFHGVTAGRWLAEKLQREFAMPSASFDFGCDTRTYQRDPGSRRDGIVFYARPGAARRGFELGLMAIESFAKRRPDLLIHFYGRRMGTLPFSYIDHGPVTPAQLNAIYNGCYAGLSLSLTNVSLVPHEMLAAGCIPVVNDAEHNRLVLDNAYVKYAAPDPHSLAAALVSVVEMQDLESHSAAAAASVRAADWDAAAMQVDTIVRSALAKEATAA
jgi:O-antigen biosynthesis protein